MKRKAKSLSEHNKHFVLNLSLIILLLTSGNSCFSQTEINSQILISSNGRFFIDRKGKPVFWQGDTEWELLHRFTVNDAKEFLLDRQPG